MLFHEIYGSYYEATAEILKEALSQGLTTDKIRKIVNEKAFAESMLNIPSKLTGEWGLISEDGQPLIYNEPDRPVTTLEKQWLKSILLDSKIHLFLRDEELEELNKQLINIDPLFNCKDIVYYDRNTDGDPFEDSNYISVFRSILRAIRESKQIRIIYDSNKEIKGYPKRLEYCEKDDVFRLYLKKRKTQQILRVAKIMECHILDEKEFTQDTFSNQRSKVTFLLKDERNALERALLQFSSFEKEVQRLGDTYKVKINYDSMDENEMLIRLLSLGPTIRVTSPETMVRKIKERVQVQLSFGE